MQPAVATAATYEAIRRGASFDRVVRNVRRLAAARAASGRGLSRLRFDVVMMKRNAHELPALVELAASLGVEAINFFHMVEYDELGTGQQSLRYHQDLSDRWLGRAIERAAALGVTVSSHPQPFEQQRTGHAPQPVTAVLIHALGECVRSGFVGQEPHPDRMGRSGWES